MAATYRIVNIYEVVQSSEPLSRNGAATEQETLFVTPVCIGSVAALCNSVVGVREHESNIERRYLLFNPDMLLTIFDSESAFGLNVYAVRQHKVRSVRPLFGRLFKSDLHGFEEDWKTK